MILITGGTGYLAGIVANYFAEKKYAVRVGTRKNKITNKNFNQNIDVVNLDLSNDSSIDNALKDVSIVLHFASMNYNECEQNSVEARIVNEDYTNNILNLSCKKNIKKFIYLSTMHVYGSNLQGNVSEETIPAPTSIYAKTHLNAENIIEKLSIKNQTEYLILRLSNVVSPPISINTNCWHLVIHDLCKQVAKKRKIHLKTNGNQSRDFVNIELLNNTIDYFLNNNGLSGIYNLGSGKSIKINEIVKIIQSECKKMYYINPEITLGDKDLNEKDFNYDVKKFKKTFPFKSLMGIEDIIKKLLSYCNNNFT